MSMGAPTFRLRGLMLYRHCCGQFSKFPGGFVYKSLKSWRTTFQLP